MNDKTKKVTVYTMENCPFCVRAKQLLTQRGISFEEKLVPLDDDSQWDELYKRSGMRTMPQIFFQDELIGGYSDLADLDKKNQLASMK